MDKVEFDKLLSKLCACREAREWADGKSLAVAWKTCERADWMLWLLAKMADKKGWPKKPVVFHAIADCAETALPFFEKKYCDDKRPREAIQIVRNYADGKINLEELKKYRAAAAAYAYDAAAYAAYAADDAAAAAAYAAADAAADADAYAAAYAAAAAAAAADADAAAADAAYAAHAAADADADAAYAAAAAAYAAHAAAAAYARKKALKNMADLIRNRIPRIGKGV
jgi:hypothetical protein